MRSIQTILRPETHPTVNVFISGHGVAQNKAGLHNLVKCANNGKFETMGGVAYYIPAEGDKVLDTQ